MRSNERSAAALGLNVFGAKLYAFMLASAIAGVGGCTLAFLNPNVVFARFDVFTSISVVTATVVGGVGFIGGALIGSTMIAGGLVSRALDEFSELGLWLALIGGVLVIVVLRVGPGRRVRDEPQAAWPRGSRCCLAPGPMDVVLLSRSSPPVGRLRRHRVTPVTLTVAGLGVRFGGVAAVRDVSLTVSGPARCTG